MHRRILTQKIIMSWTGGDRQPAHAQLASTQVLRALTGWCCGVGGPPHDGTDDHRFGAADRLEHKCLVVLISASSSHFSRKLYKHQPTYLATYSMPLINHPTGLARSLEISDSVLIIFLKPCFQETGLPPSILSPTLGADRFPTFPIAPKASILSVASVLAGSGQRGSASATFLISPRY